MHYMGQLNQFIAKALLPGPSPTQRHLQVLKATAAPDASAHPSKHTHALTHASASADTKLLATMEEAGQSGQGPLAVRTLLQDNIATESHTTEGQQPSKQQPGDQQPDLPPLDSSEVLADEIGELYMYTASDLRAIAPLWWDYSKQVRSFQDMHAEAESEYNSICFFSTNRRMEILAELPEGTQLEQPWIAEMYGIALAAAHLGIRHSSHPAIVAPSDQQRNWLNKEGPDMIVSHYAWNVEVPSLHWKWNKHAFHEWSALTCPPWSLDQQAEREAWETEYNGSSSGLFPHPPMPSELIHQEPADLFQDLASIEVVAVLNEAFCELHHKLYCPASEELSRECGKVSYCKGVNTNKDRASLCQQQEAQDKCHRSCSLCHPKTDTSSLVWYNQRSSLLRQQGGQVENITESVQAQQGIDVDQQRLVLSLLNQTTTEASKDAAWEGAQLMAKKAAIYHHDDKSHTTVELSRQLSTHTQGHQGLGWEVEADGFHGIQRQNGDGFHRVLQCKHDDSGKYGC
ncbi:MAG: hypothetical protein FRX49_10231 [Trebouxia sp. A1-2]|nr:MAG: hypothetical protein FRX49_10231 [Trebouxia sp. A1-2]